jgi:hypothetical protein
MDGDEVTSNLFPLPGLEARLRRCAEELHRGSGTCVVRGLDPARYSVEDNTILYLGIASYIGDQRGVQNTAGDMLSTSAS